MSYPIELAHFALTYSDGHRSNKFYNATLLVAATGMSLIIKRYGKIGASFGEIQIQRFAIQKKAESEFEKLVRSKTGKGYEVKNHDLKSITEEGALRMAVGPAVWPKIPAPDMKHLLPDFDTTGRPVALKAPRETEDGKWIGDPAPRVFSQAEIRAAREAERQAEQQEAVKTYAANPRFGLF